MKYKNLYLGVLLGLVVLFVSSLGSGIWYEPADYTSWPYRMFYGVCHQIPERSFLINDVPMAVNSRCFGIFTGLLIAWLALPLLVRSLYGRNWPVKILGVAVILQIIDFTGSQLSIWNSSNPLRFVLGVTLGTAVVLVLTEAFKSKK
ncbi:MAG: DUF2085 domain-containing protein [Balneolaceae bacterium]